MDLINRMMISEDDHFDLYGCVEVSTNIYGLIYGVDRLDEHDAFAIREIVEQYAMQSKKDKNYSKVVHFVWAGRTDLSSMGVCGTTSIHERINDSGIMWNLRNYEQMSLRKHPRYSAPCGLREGWYQQALFEFFKAELCRNGILQ